MPLSPADITQIRSIFAQELAASQIKISALPEAGSVSRSAVVPIVDSGSTQKMTISRLLSLGATVVPVGQDLRAMDTDTLVDRALFYTEGVVTVNDGGEGFWVYDAASVAVDNIGTVIAPDTGVGRFIRQFTGPANVRWFGAVGDGSNPDYVAIQSAVDNSLAVFAPEGTYAVGANTITINRTGASFTGVGLKTVLQTSASTATGAIEVNGDDSPAFRAYATLSDFTISGGGTTGMLLRDVANFDVVRVYVGSGYGIGIDMQGALVGSFNAVSCESNTIGVKGSTGAFSPVNLVQFTNCRISSNTKHAVWVVQGASILFSGCDFEFNGTAGQTESPLQFEDMCTIGVQPGAIFQGCWFESNKSSDGELYFGGSTGSAGISIVASGFYSTEVKFNVKLYNCVSSIYGCGMNATLTVGTFGTDSFNVSFGPFTKGVNLCNVAQFVDFVDATSVGCFPDSSGRLQNLFEFSATGIINLYLDSVNKVSIFPDAGDIKFNGPAGTHFLFNRRLWSTLDDNVSGNFAPIRSNGGILALKDMVSFGKFMKDGAPIVITGSKGGNVALANLLTAIANIGFITDSTS